MSIDTAPRANSGCLRVFVLLSCSLTVFAWMGAWERYRERKYFLDHGVATEAVVLGIGDQPDQVTVGFVASNPIRPVQAQIHYSVGVARSGGGGRSTGPRRPDGPTRHYRAQLLYLPENLQRALLLPPERWMLWITPGLLVAYGSLPVLLLLGIYWAQRAPKPGASA